MAYDDQNIFAKILRGEIPCVKVFEDDKTLAFMDVMPEAEGHVLVVPKEAAQDILDLSADGLTAMMATVQRVARAVDAALAPDGILLKQYNRAPAGQSIFHVHFHIVPRWEGVALAPHGKGMVSAAVLEPVAAKIRSALAPTNTAILERAHFPIKPGMADDFAAAFAKARKLLEATPGFQKLEMRRGIEAPDTFILLVWWDSVEAHMQGFRESPAIHEWRALLSPFFAGTPQMEHYQQSL